jgi:hypothetical protein
MEERGHLPGGWNPASAHLSVGGAPQERFEEALHIERWAELVQGVQLLASLVPQHVWDPSRDHELLARVRPMPPAADPRAGASGENLPAFLLLGMGVEGGHPAARRQVEVEQKGLTGGFASCLAEHETLAGYGVL